MRAIPSTVFFYRFIGFLVFGLLLTAADGSCRSDTDRFLHDLPSQMDRIWIGPSFWSNRLQDWRIANGRVECVVAGPNRNVHVLTRQLRRAPGTLDMSVHCGANVIDDPTAGGAPGWIGFCIGARGKFDDYRDSAIYGKGFEAGITRDGRLFVGSVRFVPERGAGGAEIPIAALRDGVVLRIVLRPSGGGDEEEAKDGNVASDYTIDLTAHDPRTGALLARLEGDLLGGDRHGNLALVCHVPKKKAAAATHPIAWFRDWTIGGSKVEAHDDHTFGPILFAQYTLSRRVLKMTAQMPPLGSHDGRSVRLEMLDGKRWKEISRAQIDPEAYTATFKVEGVSDRRDYRYRLVHSLIGAGGLAQEHHFEGRIRRNPRDEEELVIAAFTGNNDLGFPHRELVEHVRHHDPDLLFFSGDNIYETVGGYGCQRAPVETAMLEYLRKWYLYGWAYREILRDRPSVAIPDDHDVFHGNLWGAGGRATCKEGGGAKQQDSGGYKMPPQWVDMVQRTQTSHLPDPFDPRPVKQGIGVYYSALNYGGVSFAIIEDRKFKSAPKAFLPEAEIWNGWAQNPDFDAATVSDAPGAVLLGERQLAFLDSWAEDWSHGAWMKVVLSQTIFANVATLPEGAMSGAVIPRLPILPPGEYAPNERCVADHDSNGWPQSGRNRALRAMRRAFALHIAGDQHLGSTIQYGVDDWRDAGFALCVPSVSNFWPRRWYPPAPGGNRAPGAPRYTGDYRDGFGNKMTVHAVANPAVTGKEPALLWDRAAGYGIVRLRRIGRTAVIECWPRCEDPSKDGATQYSQWPVTVHQDENYGRVAFGYLPLIEVRGLTDPVVQVVSEQTGETIYTLRIEGASFQPKVFAAGTYRVEVFEPDRRQSRVLSGLKPGARGATRKVIVSF